MNNNSNALSDRNLILTQEGHTTPNVLYKFTESKFETDFITGKSIRIGTLSEYRKTEIYGGKTLDDMEGTVTFNTESKDWVAGAEGGQKFLDDIKAQTGVQIDPGLRITAGEAAIAIVCPEYYILSLTSTSSKEVAASLNPNYDCCIEIGNVVGFIRGLHVAMRHALKLSVLDLIAGFVEIKPRAQILPDYMLNPHPMIKGPGFGNLAEYRLAIESPQNPAGAMLLQIDMSEAHAKRIW